MYLSKWNNILVTVQCVELNVAHGLPRKLTWGHIVGVRGSEGRQWGLFTVLWQSLRTLRYLLRFTDTLPIPFTYTLPTPFTYTLPILYTVLWQSLRTLWYLLIHCTFRFIDTLPIPFTCTIPIPFTDTLPILFTVLWQILCTLRYLLRFTYTLPILLNPSSTQCIWTQNISSMHYKNAI